MLREINLNAFEAAFCSAWTTSPPTCKAGRHLDAVIRHHLSMNHFSVALCSWMPWISMKVAGVRFLQRILTFFCKQLGSPRSLFSWVNLSCVSRIDNPLLFRSMSPRADTNRLIFSGETWRRSTGLGSKSMTGATLCLHLLWYRASDTRRGFLFLFFPLFQEHYWLVQGFKKIGPCFLMWSRIENRTATTWLQRPKDEALHGSHEACMTAPLFTDKTTTTLCGRSVFIDGQTCARAK